MKCNDLAKQFFFEFGLPYMQERYGDIAGRMSAGLLGWGSEVLGTDDELSQDHGWGPKFSLLLEEMDFMEHGTEIEQRINAARPEVFAGINLKQHLTDPISVTTIDKLLRKMVGNVTPPGNMADWLRSSANNMLYVQSGKVFYDPAGKLRARVDLFRNAYYPESVWLGHIARQLWELWHYGDYNFRGRITRRNDTLGASIARGRVVEHSMLLAFLFNRQFAPYWKWISAKFMQLPRITPELRPLLDKLEGADQLQEQADTIKEICQFYRRVLHEHNILPDADWRNFMGAYEVVDTIQDQQTKELVRQHFLP